MRRQSTRAREILEVARATDARRRFEARTPTWKILLRLAGRLPEPALVAERLQRYADWARLSVSTRWIVSRRQYMAAAGAFWVGCEWRAGWVQQSEAPR